VTSGVGLGLQTHVVKELVKVFVSQMIKRGVLTVEAREGKLAASVRPVDQAIVRDTRAVGPAGGRRQVGRADALRHARLDQVTLLARGLWVVEAEDVVVAEDDAVAGP
jgi:hypothetical protein